MDCNKCPKCGTDVMETGFTIVKRVTETMMKLRTGFARIAETQEVSHAECMVCGAALAVEPAELMRAA